MKRRADKAEQAADATRERISALSDSALVTPAEVAALFGFSVVTLDRMTRRGDFPAPIRLGSLRRWLLGDVRAAIPRTAAEWAAPERPTVPVTVHLDPSVDAALTRYLEGTDPRVSRDAAAESAFKAFLKAKGFWPPQEGGK